MAVLLTVADYAYQVRFIMQDADGVRYTDTSIILGLKDGLAEIRRMRPDIFLGVTVNDAAALTSDLSGLPEVARVALLNYACGFVESFDQETADAGRASMFMQRFMSQMSGTGSA